MDLNTRIQLAFSIIATVLALVGIYYAYKQYKQRRRGTASWQPLILIVHLLTCIVKLRGRIFCQHTISQTDSISAEHRSTWSESPTGSSRMSSTIGFISGPAMVTPTAVCMDKVKCTTERSIPHTGSLLEDFVRATGPDPLQFVCVFDIAVSLLRRSRGKPGSEVLGVR